MVPPLVSPKGVILKPAFIYGERKVKVKGPKGKERGFKLPLQRVGRPLAKITSTGIAKRIAGKDLLVFSKSFVSVLLRQRLRTPRQQLIAKTMCKVPVF